VLVAVGTMVVEVVLVDLWIGWQMVLEEEVEHRGERIDQELQVEEDGHQQVDQHHLVEVVQMTFSPYPC